MDRIIYRLFCHEFRSDQNKNLQNKLFVDKSARMYQVLCDCLRDLDEAKYNKILGELKKIAVEDAESHAEYYAEGFCTGAKLMIEVLTAI